jgi:hypothetical protein
MAYYYPFIGINVSIKCLNLKVQHITALPARPPFLAKASTAFSKISLKIFDSYWYYRKHLNKESIV